MMGAEQAEQAEPFGRQVVSNLQLWLRMKMTTKTTKGRMALGEDGPRVLDSQMALQFEQETRSIVDPSLLSICFCCCCCCSIAMASVLSLATVAVVAQSPNCKLFLFSCCC